MPFRFVEIPPCGGVAQLVEQRTHKPRVTRSIRVTATMQYQRLMSRMLRLNFLRSRLSCGFRFPVVIDDFPNLLSVSTWGQRPGRLSSIQDEESNRISGEIDIVSDYR